MSDSTQAAQDAAANLTPADPAPTPPASAAPTPPQAPTQGDKGDQDATDDSDADGKPAGKQIETLDDAMKVIADLRAENARQRTNAKTAAADEARTEIASVLAKALGLETGGEENDDPAVQVTTLTQQVEAQTKAAQDATLELAVYKAAATAGANPTALLDSRSFLATLSTVDPADDKAVQTAITEALTTNPSFRAAQAAGPTRTDHAPGGPNSAQPKSLEEAVTAHYGG